MRKLCLKTKETKNICQNISNELRNEVLVSLSNELLNNIANIIIENTKDVILAKENNKNIQFCDRLMLNELRIKQIADSLIELTTLTSNINKVIDTSYHSKGFSINKVSVPIGVIAIIYEARPNVTIDSFALCFKSGNSVVLKGSKDCLNTNIYLVSLIKKVLSTHNLSIDIINLITDCSRVKTLELMKMNDVIDCLIPRGSAALIKNCTDNATVPIIETGSGNCHVYVDSECDFEMALNIIENSKTSRVSVCNACESVLLHQDIVDKFMPQLYERLSLKDVSVYGCEKCCVYTNERFATNDDYGLEYLDYAISVKAVKDVVEAVKHINQYSTHHSETIVTSNQENANVFLTNVDSACVYHNVSTRFSDGFEFGFKAEIGISTQKLHARGPMGLEALMSYKYIICGDGQIR